MFVYTISDILKYGILLLSVLFIIVYVIFYYINLKIKQFKNKQNSIQSHNERVVDIINKKNP